MSSPNVLVIIADTLRAKNLPMYGYDKDTAPFLSKMAEEGSHIENYFSTAPWTLPAHASMFTGKLPSEHGATAETLEFSDENKLVEYFREEGYKTFCFSENGTITEEFGFTDFDKHLRVSGRMREDSVWSTDWNEKERFLSRWLKFSSELVRRRDYRAIGELVDKVSNKYLDYSYLGEDYNPTFSGLTLETFKENISSLGEEEQFFAVVNLMINHDQYTFNDKQEKEFLPDISREEILRVTKLPYQDMKERKEVSDAELDVLKRSYDASISYLDQTVKNFQEATPEDTIIVVVGDHGENLGDNELRGRKLLEHMFGTFEETLKVPFITNREISASGFLDHRDFPELMRSLVEEGSLEGRDHTVSEWYGKPYLLDRRIDGEISSELKDLYTRKSFSVIDKDWKLDITSDGEKISSISSEDRSTEAAKNKLKSKIPFVLKTVLEDEELIN